jgi:hypothetical protein
MALILTGSSGSTTLDSSAGLTFSDSSNQQYAAGPYVLKNRIINGAMVIDQRNNGAAVTFGSTGTTYTLDRWLGYCTQTSKWTFQQNAGSVTTPSGFSKYLGITSSSAYSITSTDLFFLMQNIEGFNTSDLNFGTANAQTITLSFWVRSSLTGTFGGAIQNSNQDRNYPFTFTINSANTWEQKSITVPGDTTGTWIGATNGIGLRVCFGLGVGSTYSGTAGAWTSSVVYGVTGTTSIVGTNGATFYITGVQLEAGSTATPFERRLYNQELANCQRYLPAFGGTTGALTAGFCNGTTGGFVTIQFPITARVSPTGITVPNATYFTVYNSGAIGVAVTSLAFSIASTSAGQIGFNVASGLTAGNGTLLTMNNAAAQLLFTGCEL